MNSKRQGRLAAKDGRESIADDVAFTDPASYSLLAPHLRRAITKTRSWLLGEQQSDGYWIGELEGDTLLESEYILLLAFLEREGSEHAGKAAQYLLEQQNEEGGWSLYPGGATDVTLSVKAYFALKLTGHEPSAEYMQRAREAILAAGGADRVNSFTRFYLALLGQISYDVCPEVPPEMVLAPRWFPLNIYRISAWSRTMVVPLSIMSAYRPVRQIDPARGIRELFIAEPKNWPPLRSPGQPGSRRARAWEGAFRLLDRGAKLCRKLRLLPLRRKAIRTAEAWMLDRFEGSDGLGAICPPIVWSIVALRCLGYDDESPEVRYNHRQLEGLMIEEEETLRLQPCKSPVWDTAISMRALSASGVGRDHPAMEAATDWLLEKEVRRRGDWSATVKCEPGGWCFEHNNEFYPDLDDTAMVLSALRTQLRSGDLSAALPPGLQVFDHRTRAAVRAARDDAATDKRLRAAAGRAIDWTLAMQNRDGGWGAFDRNNDCEVLCHVPFADHNAMIDPSTPDLTARVLEGLAPWGYKIGHPAIDRATAYLRRTQQPDGSWYGRWGVNYIYGTWQTLVGLRAIGVPAEDPAVVAAVQWLLAYQQADGGWGESADSYAAPHKRGQGTATASQTAWALLGLLSAGCEKHPAVARGARYLIENQEADGTWEEPEFTGTGFPQVFYLRYHLYRIYFPLLALATWAVSGGSAEQSQAADHLRVVGEQQLSVATS